MITNSMRIITWNIRRATKDSLVWDLILELKPDIALLQEVGSIPDKVNSVFEVISGVPVSKTGKFQKFTTMVLVKGKIVNAISLSSTYEWVNREIKFFRGNFISCVAKLQNKEPLNLISVYSPAWPVDKNRLREIDVSPVKLKSNSEVWATEIIWAALKNTVSNNELWVVGGDYNSSETFDKDWPGGPPGIISDGNKEIRERMYSIGFKECLREYNGKLVPTFQNSQNKKIIHQIDHLYVSDNLYQQLGNCVVGDKNIIFRKSLSDHLPIISDFKDAIN